MGLGTKSIALQRIQRLFYLAREVVHENPALAQRYIHIARRVAMAARIPMMTTTIISSIKVKPFLWLCFLRFISFPLDLAII